MEENTITKKQAKQMLKDAGLSIKSLAEYLGIQPRAITTRWQSGTLNPTQTLMLRGYIAQHDKDYQTVQQHRDDSVIAARLDQLKSQDT